jgi:hypothetical protein
VKSQNEESNSFLNDEEEEDEIQEPQTNLMTFSSDQSESSISKISENPIEKKNLDPISHKTPIRNLQFINDKPYLQLKRSELNLNDLFLRIGVSQNGSLKLCAELVYQLHKYSLFSFPK